MHIAAMMVFLIMMITFCCIIKSDYSNRPRFPGPAEFFREDRMKSKKFFGTLIMMLVLTMAGPAPVFAAGALTAETAARYSQAVGTKTVKGNVYSTGASGWQTIGSTKYYFDFLLDFAYF